MTGTQIILGRELNEMRRSPLLLLSMISLPVTMVGVPLLTIWYLMTSAPEMAIAVIRELYGTGGDAPALVIAQAAAQNWLPIFLVMPVFLPILIAAQSVGGERERRTLEPLLATPVATSEIVLGKSLAAVIPAVAITWASAALFTGGLSILVWRFAGAVHLPDGVWVFSILVLSPLLALFGNTLAVVVSARVMDPRAAQNIAAMSVVPLIGLLGAQLTGRVALGLPFYLLLALGIVVIDIGLVWAATLLFDRERLLTSWR